MVAFIRLSNGAAARADSTGRTLPLVGVWVLGMMTGADVSAQSLDYPAMEQLFGEPVTTSATGKPQRASDAPVNMEIITQDDIRRSGATSIPDVLQFVQGVDVRRYGLADADVGIRGYNQPYNPRLLVLVDGRQVYSDDFSHMAWPTIPVQLREIRQIEVIKGPNSALYGFNAVSGVINIITYDPLRERVNAVAVRAGTQDYAGGSLVGTHQFGDNAGVRASFGGFRAHDVAPGALARADRDIRQPPGIGAFNFDGRLHMVPGVEAFVEASATDSRFAEETFTGRFDTTFTRTNSVRTGFTADTRIGLVSLSAYRNAQNISISATSLKVSLHQRVDVLQVSDLVKLGADHTLRLGLEYRDSSASSPQFFRGTVGYAASAASLMWDWQITRDLSWTNAIRHDDLRLNYSGRLAAGSGITLTDFSDTRLRVPSFNSGLVYHLTQQDTLRMTLARGVQLPSLVNFGFQFPFGALGPAVVTGDPHLKPSIVDGIELGYDRALPSLASALRIALYAQRNRDLISEPLGVPVALGPTGIPLLKAANVGGSDAVGFEIGIKGHAASGLRWQASYAYARTTDETVLNRGRSITSPIDYAHSVPRHVVLGGVGYTHGRLEMDLLARWQSSYRDFQSTSVPLILRSVEVPNYLSLDGRIGYRLTENVSVALSLQQFNSARQLQTAGPPVERRAIVSLTAEF
jgi:outer membrane receptor for ferrienterochelin and colicins